MCKMFRSQCPVGDGEQQTRAYRYDHAGHAERSRRIGESEHHPLDVNLVISIINSDTESLVEQYDDRACDTGQRQRNAHQCDSNPIRFNCRRKQTEYRQRRQCRPLTAPHSEFSEVANRKTCSEHPGNSPNRNVRNPREHSDSRKYTRAALHSRQFIQLHHG